MLPARANKDDVRRAVTSMAVARDTLPVRQTVHICAHECTANCLFGTIIGATSCISSSRQKGRGNTHGYPQILEVGVTALRTHRDGLRSSVIVYNCGVIDGNVGGTALKISHRVTTL